MVYGQCVRSPGEVPYIQGVPGPGEVLYGQVVSGSGAVPYEQGVQSLVVRTKILFLDVIAIKTHS